MYWNFRKISVILSFLFFVEVNAQSTTTNILRGAEIITSGLSIFATSKNNNANKTVIDQVCIKNKLTERITFKIYGVSDATQDDIKKELVIPVDGKECFLNLPKGVYTYEVILSNKEIYRKGEYHFKEDVVIAVKTE
ncbi:hypothetical protein [Flavobacterium sp.]|uniref:hypothetical protein n=1 Tax=Flavobacterium sp. TaxID=239 RepID=UPI0026035298|nr:hypothetical protein [Flavobacterium sp.]